MFALDTLEPAQKQCEQRLLLGQKRVAVCQIAEDGSLIEIVGEAASTSLEMKSRKRRAGDNGTTTAPLDGGEIDVFDNLPDVDFKKKKKSMKFADENLDPATAISKSLKFLCIRFSVLIGIHLLVIYPDLDNPNNEHVLMSSQPTHTAPQVSVFSDGLTVSNEKVFTFLIRAAYSLFLTYLCLPLLSLSSRDTEWRKQRMEFGRDTGTLKSSSTSQSDTRELDGVRFQEIFKHLVVTIYFPIPIEIVQGPCFTIVDP